MRSLFFLVVFVCVRFGLFTEIQHFVECFDELICTIANKENISLNKNNGIQSIKNPAYGQPRS